ncbi:hypothetical protein Nepgr_029158 [Nepenthes gracilis]|uniref:SPX domain-containing protein n=1 Tax=Nepenthes gracilis TaxID=150966 RepID=A0AAD3Y4L5_NEPGR|nr:hypothetical protein Nepgr_029158 [Nepenthes gracilis]
MKFGKSLSNQIEETLPEWRDKFLSYKELKKRLKLIDAKVVENNDRQSKRQRLSVSGGGDCADGVVGDDMSKEEVDFIKLLEVELEKFNAFFVEKEEEYVIRLKELQDRVPKAKDLEEEMLKIRKEIVDFHGEMVLLENYSALNYTGLVKILKKYDKRTGALIRLPFIQRVLQQPFFTTDMLYKLVKECERMLDVVFPTVEPSIATEPATTSCTRGDNNDLLNRPNELTDIEYVESLYMKSTVSALKALMEIRSGSSTVSMFSLPPLQCPGPKETWKKVTVPEQVAK